MSGLIVVRFIMLVGFRGGCYSDGSFDVFLTVHLSVILVIM